MALRQERILASVSTIVVVAGQTQVHVVTLATVRPTIVPPIVPGPPQPGAVGCQGERPLGRARDSNCGRSSWHYQAGEARLDLAARLRPELMSAPKADRQSCG